MANNFVNAMTLMTLDSLNPAQRAAATVGGGRHLVLAGPGTGKTTTLVARVVHLISSGVDPAPRPLPTSGARASGIDSGDDGRVVRTRTSRA